MIASDIAGVSIRSLVEKYGTPLYVYDAGLVAGRIDDLKGFPTIRYAQKANSNLTLLNFMRKRGVKVDAVSAGEIHRAIKAGYTPADIVYTSDIFDHPALDVVAKLGIRVNCGSPDMIPQYAQRVEKAEVTLRINPGFGHGHTQKTNTGGEQSKHGIWHEDLPAVLDLARDHGVEVTGLHMHIGSGTDFDHLAKVCDSLSRAADRVGPGLKIISSGGGLPVPYRPEDKAVDVAAFVDLWLKTRDVIQSRLGTKLELEVEPGRYLVAEAGTLIAEIRAIKRMGANTFYLLNAGFMTLARAAMYGAYHPMAVCYADPDKTDDGYRQPTVVGGPLCESGDIFTQRDGGFVETRSLPRASVSDFLLIQVAGAYGFTMASNYNSFPYPPEVVVQNGHSFLARERQTVDDLTRGERVVALA
jgi:diaminopimelate decarboxylase